MKVLIPSLLLLLGGCATRPEQSVASLPPSAVLFDADLGTAAGSWRALGDPRFTLSLMSLPDGRFTFAAQRGCVATGGLLEPGGGDAYRITRWDGFEAEGCGPWRAGPEVAPFDAGSVTLMRSGAVLTAGAKRFQRFRDLDLTVRPEHLYGTWRLRARTANQPEREAQTRLELGPDRFVFASACNNERSGGLVTLPGLEIKQAGSERIGQTGECDMRTTGDFLIEQFSQGRLRLTYRPADDRIVASLPARSYEFVRE